MLSNWRNPPRPVEKSAEQGSHITGKHREVGGRREGLGRAYSSGEAGNDLERRGPAVCNDSNKKGSKVE